MLLEIDTFSLSDIREAFLILLFDYAFRYSLEFQIVIDTTPLAKFSNRLWQ